MQTQGHRFSKWLSISNDFPKNQHSLPTHSQTVLLCLLALVLAIIRLLSVLTGLTKPERNYSVLFFNPSCWISFPLASWNKAAQEEIRRAVEAEGGKTLSVALGLTQFLWNLTLHHHMACIIHRLCFLLRCVFLSFNSNDFYSLRGGMVLIEKLIYITHIYTCVYMKYQSRSQDFSY